MKPDIVLYVRSGENEELRYAIRTWCENLEFGRLCASGGPFPRWFHPDIAHENRSQYGLMKQCYYNLLAALSDDQLTDEVLVMMDDIFIINRVGEWKINHNRGTLLDQYNRMKKKTGYADLLLSTHEELGGGLSFEEHAPFRCDRRKLLKLLQDYGPQKMPLLLWRSMYGNTYKAPTEYKKDIKLAERTSPMPHTSIISTNERSWAGTAGIVLRDWYPTPSKYER